MMMRGKVLIVEDNRALADLWVNYLKRHGFDPIAFIDNHTDVAAVLAWGTPEVIVSGVESEGPMTGEEICRQIYGERPGEKPPWPVIQLYGSHLTEEQEKRLAATSFLLLRKPVPPGTLLEAVRKAWFRATALGLQRHSPATMTAELAGQALGGVLQFVASGKRTGYVLVEGASGQAVLAFADGMPVAARGGTLTGQEVVYEVLSWNAGQAAFHPVDRLDEERQALPELADLLTEGQRQAEAAGRARARLTKPGILLQRNESVKIVDDPAITRIYLAIDREISWNALRAALPQSTERQLLTALHDMLGRGEILMGGEAPTPASLPDDVRQSLGAWLHDAPEPPLLSCSRAGIFSVSGRLTRRFLGLLTGQEEACTALLEHGDSRLALTAGCTEGRGACDGLAGGMVMFNAADHHALAPTLVLLTRAHDAGVSPLIVIVVPDEEDNPLPAVDEIVRRLEVDPAEIPVLVMPAWTPAAAREALARLLSTTPKPPCRHPDWIANRPAVAPDA